MSIFISLFPAGSILEATEDSFQDTEALSTFEINPVCFELPLWLRW